MSGGTGKFNTTELPYGAPGTMNRPQQVLVWLAVACAALMLLCPPWTHTGFFSHLGFAGYGWVFAPPPRASIALAQLVIQLLLMGVVLGAGYVLLGRAKWSPSAAQRTLQLLGRVAVTLAAMLIAGVANRVSIANGGSWEGGAVIALAFLGFLGWVWKKPATSQKAEPSARPTGVPPHYLRRPRVRGAAEPRRGIWVAVATITFLALAVWGGAQWLEAADSAREEELASLHDALDALSQERTALMRDRLRRLAESGSEDERSPAEGEDARMRKLEERDAEIRARLKALGVR